MPGPLIGRAQHLLSLFQSSQRGPRPSLVKQTVRHKSAKMPIKPIPSLLSMLILLALGACTLRIPEAEAPTAIVSVTGTPFIAVATPTGSVVPTTLPTFTATALLPTEALPTPAPPTASTLPATQAPQAAASQPAATQPAPTPTPTPITTFDPYSAYGRPKYENRMEIANLAEWAQAEKDTLPDNRNIRLQFEDGELYVTGKRSGFSTWWFSYHTLSDAYIEMTFDSENCSGEDAYGIVFRGPPHLAGESYGYIVSFTCNGRLWVYRLDGVNPWEAEILIDVEKSSAINTGPGEQNVIGVRAEGDQFVIFANGSQVAEVEDDQYEKGRVGVFVRAVSPNAYTYRVTNFAYWILGVDE